MYKFSCYLPLNLISIIIFPPIISLFNLNSKIILFDKQTLITYIILRAILIISYIKLHDFYKKYKIYDINLCCKFIKYISPIVCYISDLLLIILFPMVIFNIMICIYGKILTKINIINILYEISMTYNYHIIIFYGIMDIINIICCPILFI